MNNLTIFRKKALMILLVLTSSFGIFMINKSCCKNIYFLKDYSILFAVFSIMYYCFYSYLFKRNIFVKKDTFFSFLFSIFISSTLVIGSQLQNTSNVIFSYFSIMKILSGSFALFPLLIIILNKYKTISFNDTNVSLKKTFIFSLIFITIINFIYWLALFPGIYGYDAPFQLLQYFDSSTKFTTHYSIIYSYFFGFIVSIGKNLFNSYTAGFALYTFIQMLIMNIIYSYICTFTYKKSNKYVYIFALLLFTIIPLNSIMSLSSAQDVFFAGIFAIYIIELIKYCDSVSKKGICLLLITSLLLCLARNNGIYVLYFTLIYIFICGKVSIVRNKKLIFVLLISILSNKLIYSYVYPAINVEYGASTREMLSVPSQQIARIYNYNSNVITSSKYKNVFLNFYPNTDMLKYYTVNPEIADMSKAAIDNDYAKNNLKLYAKMYFYICSNDIENCVEGFLFNNLGLWYFDKTYYDYRMYHPYIEFNMVDAKSYNTKYIEIKRDSKIPIINKYLSFTVGENKWQYVPILCIFLKGAFYFTLFVFAFVYSYVYKKGKYKIVYFAVLGLYLTIILAPVYLYRYGYPIMIIFPLLMSLCCYKKNDV